MTPSTSQFLKTKDVAAYYGVKPATVVDWVRTGKLKPALTTPSNRPLFRPADFPA